MASLIHATAHTMVAGDTFKFANVHPTDSGIDENTTYYVLAAGLTADAFTFSTALAGTPFVLTNAITDGTIVSLDSYTVLVDGVMDPPTAPSAPGSCVLSSAAVQLPDGTTVARLDITITQPASATLRHTVVTVTGGSNVEKVIIPVGQTTGSIVSVVPGVSYTGSAVAYDTFGLASSATASAAHVAAGDTTPPSQVTSAAAAGGIRAAFVSWAGSSAADLSHYEIQIDASSGFGTAVTYKIKVSVASFVELAVGTWYFRIRAVDLSGNAGTYSATVSATSRLVTGGSDILANSITANDVLAGSITADRLSVGARPAGAANRVLNASFEDFVGSALTGWTISSIVTGGGVTSVPGQTTTQHGTYSTATTKSLATDGGGIMSTAFPVTPGEVYYCSVWQISSIATTNGFYFRLEFGTDPNMSGSSSQDIVSSVATSAAWQQAQGYVTAPAGAKYMRVHLLEWVTNVNSAFFFDNVVVERVAGGIKNSDGNVTIDASGITITNGKLTFTDQFGATAMNGYGFGPSWVRFIHDRFYNGDFAAGTVGSDFAVTETGSGTPLANYLASLSANLPSWVVAQSDSLIKIVADANATSGQAIESSAFAAGNVSRIYQDVPIAVGQAYRIDASCRWSWVSGTMGYKTFMSWRDSTHAIIGVRTQITNLAFGSAQATYTTLSSDTGTLAATRAPSNATYLRFEIELTHTTTTGQVFYISDLRAKEIFIEDGPYTTNGLTLTTAYQDITSVTLSPGRYLVLAAILSSITTAGVGDVNVDIELDGVQKNALGATWAAPAATAKNTVSTHAYINVQQGVAGVLKVRALKTINAGVATTSANSMVTIIGLK